MKKTVRKPVVPEAFWRLAQAAEENTSFRIVLVSPLHPALRVQGRWGATNFGTHLDPVGMKEIMVANRPEAVYILGHELAHVLFSYSAHNLPVDTAVQEWVCDRVGITLARYFRVPAPKEYSPAAQEALVRHPIVERRMRRAARNIVREILSWFWFFRR